MVCLWDSSFTWNLTLSSRKTHSKVFTLRSGRGTDGQLGHGNLDRLSTFSKVTGLEGHSICQLASGNKHTVSLTSKGFVFTFGSNEDGQTGHGIVEGNQNTPKKVTAGCLDSKKVVFIASNYKQTACITADDETYTWGKGRDGRLGHGDETNLSIPKVVNGLVCKNVKEIVFGVHHTIAKTVDGRLYSFGNGEAGQLGHGNLDSKFTPTAIEYNQLGEENISKIACGFVHSMALTCEGRLYTWGSGHLGQLGHGLKMNCCDPTIVDCLIQRKVTHIASLHTHSVALVDLNWY